MIRIIPSADRFHADNGWLDARWHFSFAHYHDPANTRFGPLRVFNDDLIRPGGGFAEHGHDNMEIVTIVLAGALRHADSLGHQSVITPGEVQVMSAGRGIRHSEFNASPTDDVRLMQVWLLPRNRDAPPRYDQKRFDLAAADNRWTPLVSDGSIPGALTIDQDASFHRARLTPAGETSWSTSPRRRVYLFVIDGSIELNGQTLGTGDQARIESEPHLTLRGGENGADLLLIDLP